MGGRASNPVKKLVFLGLDNAGKSSIVAALTGTSPYAVRPTRSFQTREKELDGVFFEILDVGGQKPLRSHWGDHLVGVAGIVWVIDSADPRRMYETGLELASLLSDERTRGVPVLVLANKKDLATAMSAGDIAAELELSLIRDRPWQIQACSAIVRDAKQSGIEDGLRWMQQALSPKPMK
jgi:ADP-ribosylation factor-like protein 3